ncbi:choice-of-anchor L domain-containing protein [Oceanomicrobium pacificus]|uniref:2,3,4,5-tetrahydropyridine-2,6-carboxylate N-succinyltransferase n=1 Tax=Oceanomicrobium pacificus TaxID=2692916 RepID=A0A6B0TI32_9RHOB|nr:choice-of-anchor L domain-containing protein [Oceanomicrobium pacificus]MXU64070.1 2,3,4,5-tetrahydropyridine-2,6-carboxylate N-succinyltransferase [Oceanomicrobium pacificus]
MVAASKLPVNTNVTAEQMAEEIFGAGISIESASYTGDPVASGIYSDGLATSPGVAPSDTGVILSTGKATDFTQESGDSNQAAWTTTNTSGPDGVSDLNQIAGMKTFDAAIFEAEFIPEGNTLSMQIVFSSEEYLEYTNSGFNDAVGIWVNGTKAEMTVGDGEISIDNINDTSNQNLFVDNTSGIFNTEMDGFTVTMTLKAPVNPDEINTIRIGVADAGDASYDSNLLIKGDSIQTAVVAGDDELEVRQGQEAVVDLLDNDFSSSGSSLTITAINGVPVVAGTQVALPTGELITLNLDGTITVTGNDTEGENTFSYMVEDEAGNTDTGFATVTTIPCFSDGTLIETVRGAVPVEALQVGDLVHTLDHGPQPIRWTGRVEVAGTDRFAPVVLPVSGNRPPLRVSPQHRLFVSATQMLLLHEVREVLVSARDLVRTGLAAEDPVPRLRYHHILFDRHEIVCAHGLWSESYHPGATILSDMDADVRAELLALFPELGRPAGQGGRVPARPIVKAADIGAACALGTVAPGVTGPGPAPTRH